MKVKYNPTLKYQGDFLRRKYKKQIEFDEYVKLLYTRMENKNGQITRTNKQNI
jgi:hypothetical protein